MLITGTILVSIPGDVSFSIDYCVIKPTHRNRKKTGMLLLESVEQTKPKAQQTLPRARPTTFIICKCANNAGSGFLRQSDQTNHTVNMLYVIENQGLTEIFGIVLL